MLWVFAAGLGCKLPDGDAPAGDGLVKWGDLDGDDYDVNVDCDDDDRDVHPGAEETCGNGQDDNCNRTSDGCDWSGELALEGTKLTGTEDYSSLGTTLAVCDANGDGVDDVVTSASGYDVADPGVYVFYGPIYRNRDAHDADYALMGDSGMYTGASIDCRRDIDGDGVADIIVGEPGGSRGADPGTVYVVPGGGSGRPALADEASSSWTGWDAGELLGYQVVAIDADGDEADELAVTPTHTTADPSRYGIAYLFEGLGIHNVDAAVAYVYGTQFDRLDVIVGNAGDLDGDGVEDLALEGNDDNGEQLLVFGAPLVGAISKSDADIEIIGGPPDGARWSAIGHADLDADGRDDLFVGNSRQNGHDGAVFAFLTPIASHTETKDAEWQLVGPARGDHGVGSDVASAGDVDGDDIPDLLIGAAHGETVYLQYGGDRGVHQLEKTAQARWHPEVSGGAGASVGAGDVTGAGIVDLVIGSPGDGQKYEGSITIVPSWQL